MKKSHDYVPTKSGNDLASMDWDYQPDSMIKTKRLSDKKTIYIPSDDDNDHDHNHEHHDHYHHHGHFIIINIKSG